MARTLLTSSELESLSCAGITPEEVLSMQRRILIADDNEQTRDALRQLLEGDHKVQVDTTSDGSQALKALSEQNYSIILTDLCMPRLDGLELIQALQKQRIT